MHPGRSHRTTRTPPSQAALEMIGKHQQHNHMITFFGESSCGKRRAVVEMLARNWGFYLNANKDDRDIVINLRTIALNMYGRFVKSNKTQNGEDIQAIFTCLLLTRLLVLPYSLSLGCRDTFTSEHWVLFQICPGAFDGIVGDVINVVFTEIVDHYRLIDPAIPLHYLMGLLRNRFQEVRLRLSSNLMTNKFRVVLDEAQDLSDRHRRY
ncbi:hypothetical protein BG011_000940 [Mortierella polycephala]|uniref:Uncharacterized protein n=1 Tax=Mortierella polycephala TaxID=41804 RepID=A0A9P6U6A8_9FUNG|nr:hypothetical protein BG011_000940 [Mortierella polycephala]